MLGFSGLFYYLSGYRYLFSDQTHYLLEAMRLIKTDFCLNDWFVWQTVNYHFSFTRLVVLLSSLGNPAIIFLAVYLILAVILIWGVYRLVEKLGGDILLFPLVFIFAFAFIQSEISATKLMGSSIVPSTLAPPFAVWFLLFLIDRKFLRAGAMLGISGLIHINYGYGGLIILICCLLFFSEYKEHKWILLSPVIALIIMSPNLIPAFKYFYSSLGSDTAVLNDLLIRYRSPHHYYPPDFDFYVALNMIGIYTLGLVELWPCIRQKEFSRVAFISAVIGILCLASVFFATVIYWPTFLRFYFWRYLPFVTLFSLILIALGIREVIERGCWQENILGFHLILTLGASLYYQGFALAAFAVTICLWTFLRLSSVFEKKKELLLYGCLASLTFLVAAALSDKFRPLIALAATALLFGHFYRMIRKMERYHHLSAIGICLTVTLILSQGGVIPRLPKNPLKPGVPQPLVELASWAKQKTPPGTTFIAPPDIRGFRLLSERAILVNVKCIPFKPEAIREWWRRLKELVDIEADPSPDEWFDLFLNRYMSLPPEHFQKLAYKYQAGYLIAYKEQKNLFDFVSRGWTLAYENPVYAVFTADSGFQ